METIKSHNQISDKSVQIIKDLKESDLLVFTLDYDTFTPANIENVTTYIKKLNLKCQYLIKPKCIDIAREND